MASAMSILRDSIQACRFEFHPCSFDETEQLFTFTENKPILQRQHLHDALEVHDAVHEEVAVICVVEPLKKRNRVFTYMLRRYLDHYHRIGNSTNWSETVEQHLWEFNLVDQQESVRKGIWIWVDSKPLDGKRIVVLHCIYDTRKEAEFSLKMGLLVTNAVVWQTDTTEDVPSSKRVIGRLVDEVKGKEATCRHAILLSGTRQTSESHVVKMGNESYLELNICPGPRIPENMRRYTNLVGLTKDYKDLSEAFFDHIVGGKLVTLAKPQNGSGFITAVERWYEKPSACPEQVVRYEISESDLVSQFDARLVQQILEERNALNHKLHVVAITGVCRSGKSFLLNLMMTYLDYYEQNNTDDGWERQTEKVVKGVNWAKGVNQSVTHGVWMWMYPKPINGVQIAFLDLQGTGDHEKSSETLDHSINLCGLMLSDNLIVNVRNQITPGDLQRVGMCLLDNLELRKSAFCKRINFLIRDWPDMEDKPLQLQDMQNEEARKIHGGCEEVRVSALPHPGKTVPKACEGDGLLLRSIDEDFREHSKELFNTILIANTRNPRRMQTGQEFLEKFKRFSARTATDVPSRYELMKEKVLNDAFEEVEGELVADIEGVLEQLFTEEGNTAQQALQQMCEESKKKLLADPRISMHADENTRRKFNADLQQQVDNAQQAIHYQHQFANLDEEVNNLRGNATKKRKKLFTQLEALRSSPEDENLQVKAERLKKEYEQSEEMLKEILGKKAALLDKRNRLSLVNRLRRFLKKLFGRKEKSKSSKSGSDAGQMHPCK